MLPIKDDIPTVRKPVLTISLIVVNVLVFLYQQSLGLYAQDFIWQFGVVPWEITNFASLTPNTHVPNGLTLFTSMFLHGGWLHLGSNMLYLWIFGNNVEDKLGPVHFIIFYFAVGVLAALAFVVINPSSQVPLVGASGAVAGLLGMYIVAYPRARVLTILWIFFFIRLVWLPAVFFLGLWFVLQLFSSLPTLAGGGTGGIAYVAHVAGFAAGLVYCKFWCMRRGGLRQ